MAGSFVVGVAIVMLLGGAGLPIGPAHASILPIGSPDQAGPSGAPGHSNAIGANATWTNITGNITGPLPPGSGGLIAFDAHDNYTIVFTANYSWVYAGGGGNGYVAYIPVTLAYHAGQWTNLTGAGGPAPQDASAMAYDPALGGVALIELNGTLWLFQSGNWSELNTTGDFLPAPYGGFLMAYDSADGYLLVSQLAHSYSCFDSPPETCTGTDSAWSLSSNLTWSSVAGFPQQIEWAETWDGIDVVQPAMVYDQGAGVVLAINDGGWTYAYTGGSWSNLSWNIQASIGVNLLDHAMSVGGESMAYDAQLDGTILFGGVCYQYYDYRQLCNYHITGYNTTWIYQAGNWTNISGPTDPSPRADVALAYDGADGYLLAYGGSGEVYNESTGYATYSTVQTQAWMYSNARVFVSPTGRLTLSVSPAPTDIGVPANVSVSFSGGQMPFTYRWSNGTDNWTTGVNRTVQSFARPGQYPISVTVTDRLGTYQRDDSYVAVNTGPTTSWTLAPNQTVGVPEVFDATGSNGTGPYHYAWSFGDGTRASTQSGTHSYATSGSFLATVTTIDLLGQQVSSTETVTVATAIGATISISNSTASLGQSVWFNVSASGGLGVLHYVWIGLPEGCSSEDEPTIGCLPTQAGAYAVTVSVTDAFHGEASPTTNLSVIFDFSISVSATTIRVGQNLTIGVESTANGLTFSYRGLPPGCIAANRPTLTCSPTAVGNYTIRIVVSDVVGNSASRSFLLEVEAAAGTPRTSPPPRPTPPATNGTPMPQTPATPPSPTSELLVLALVGVSAALGGLVVMVGGRWKHRPPGSSKQMPTGPKGEDPLEPGGTER